MPASAGTIRPRPQAPAGGGRSSGPGGGSDNRSLSDAPASALWVGNIEGSSTSEDVRSVFGRWGVRGLLTKPGWLGGEEPCDSSGCRLCCVSVPASWPPAACCRPSSLRTPICGSSALLCRFGPLLKWQLRVPSHASTSTNSQRFAIVCFKQVEDAQVGLGGRRMRRWCGTCRGLVEQRLGRAAVW